MADYNTCYCQGNYCGLAKNGSCMHLYPSCCPDWPSGGKGKDGAWGGTGQSAKFRRADGAKDGAKDSGTKILGLDMKQALIAVGVGVAAFLVIKKMK